MCPLRSAPRTCLSGWSQAHRRALLHQLGSTELRKVELVSSSNLRKKMLASNLRLLAILICAATVAAFAWAQFRDHRPPWPDPVASTRTIDAKGSSIQIDFGPGSTNLPQERVVQ